MKKNSNYILIAEDNIQEIELYKRAFKDLGLGLHLVFVNDGEQAFNYLNEHHDLPLLIISDVKMPKMDGLSFLRKIQENKQIKIKSIPIVFFSNSSTPEEVLEAYELSAQGYFLKPMDFENLKKILKRIVEYWSESQLPKFLM